MAAEELAVRLTSEDLSAQGLLSFVKNIQAGQDAVGELARRMGELQGKSKESAEGLSKLGEIGKIAAGVFGGITIEKVLDKFIEFHKTTMEQVAGLGSLADRYGLTTDQLQAYQAAARTANVTDKELNSTLATFNITLGNAANGNA